MANRQELAGIAMTILLAACASHPPAPVIDLTAGDANGVASSEQSAAATSGKYRVQAGDSLYTIAFRHDLDWRQLARWNGIAAPYTIYPGMTLHMTKPAHAPSSRPLKSETVVTTRPAPVSTLPQSTTKVPAQAATPVTSAARTEPEVVVAGEPLVVQPKPQAQTKAVVAPTVVRRVNDINWSWPNAGPVIGSFRAGDPTRHGIDIGGTRGEPVLATADGVVVYSGNGLVGYGELVIIKHSDTFLSAYGHNSKRLVQEGQHVRRGEKIAEMGSSGTSRTELHFEIRRQGDPVDPLAFLPHR